VGDRWSEHGSDNGVQSTDPEIPSVPLTAKGVTGVVTVDGHFVNIDRKGFFAKANYGWTRGVKRIPIASITAVQFKKPGMARGYIQFTIPGGNESRKGILDATKDENSVLFGSTQQRDFERIRDHVESLIVARNKPVEIHHHVAPAPAEVADLPTRLRGLAALRDDGLLTQEEFDEQKAKLLDG
jgi:hypothetical protein